MGRLKTFGMYLLIFVAFYIFSTIASIGFINSTYKDMDRTIKVNDSIEVKINEAKATFVNGYVKGSLKNISENNINDKYIKIDLLSKNNNIIYTKYIKINELDMDTSSNFTINFRAENIKRCEISITDKYVYEESKVELIELKDAQNETVKGISIGLACIILVKYFIL